MNTDHFVSRLKNKGRRLLKKSQFSSPNGKRLKSMHDSGDLVVIPIGFRCFTKERIYESLGLSLKLSLPFDSGFFPPESVARILGRGEVDLRTSRNHTVCTKEENAHDSNDGLGIKFEKSSYEVIDAAVKNKDSADINNYLDSTYGYYTLDLANEFILAHYNWHAYASEINPSRVSDPVVNIENINKTLNRRLDRMFEMVDRAKYVFFVFSEDQGYQYMAIDDRLLDLQDLDPVRNVVKGVFPERNVYIEHLREIDSPSKLLSKISSS